MDEIAENCTRAAVLSKGEVVLCGAPKELFAHADELYSLGLDIPTTAKICAELEKLGLPTECDFTSDGFAQAVITALGGGNGQGGNDGNGNGANDAQNGNEGGDGNA